MAEIKPFRGLRYTAAAGPIGTLTCPPADGAEKSPCNAGRLALRPAAEAGPLLQQWLTESLVKIDMDPAFYLYEQQTPENGRMRTVRGFLALVRLDASVQLYDTDSDAATGADCGANCGTKEAHGAAFPICAFYRDESGLMQKRLDALSQDTPRYSLQAGGAVHRLWIINDPVVLRASCADFTGRLLAVAGGEAPGGERNAQLYRAAQARCKVDGEHAWPGDTAEALMLLIDEERGASLSVPDDAEAAPPEPIAPALPAVPAGLVMQPCDGLDAPL